MVTNTEIWDQLKTVPKEHLKPFQRGGGFRGTAIKPMWTYHRMTEVFGPCGKGWGIGKPDFTVQPAGNDTLVYCTVTVWYGPEKNELIGVGGDKVLTTNKNGPYADDEAFKKAFTDAITNALKTLGAGAEVHMGHYDGLKYTRHDDEPTPEPRQERPAPSPAPRQEAPPAPPQGSVFATLEQQLRSIEDAGKLDMWVGEAQAAKAAGKVTTSEWGRLRSLHASRVAFLAQAPRRSAA